MTASLTALADGRDMFGAFPFDLPDKKPNRPLSAALERNYDNYLSPRQEENELYSLFKYTELTGFDYHGGDGTVSRRDPSKIIFENGQYYVWYTKRETEEIPTGLGNAHLATDTRPSADWDLAEIWYATSKDGITWEEQGIAVPRPPKPNVGWRSVATPDILKWKDKYYLYYQGFVEISGKGDSDCPVAVSVADSPNGPWKALNKVIIPNGKKGEWDQNAIHDPYPLVHNGKIYLYYKSDFDRIRGSKDRAIAVRMQGLAIAENPLGPFVKHPLNPVLNSGHETALFPFKEGVAALIIRDGNERSTVQYAQDWVNFNIASVTELMPNAAGLYVPDAFTNTEYGQGVTWGLSHFTVANGWDKNHSILTRFDTDLSLKVNDPEMKRHNYHYSPAHHYKFGLSAQQKKRIAEQNKKLQKQ
ncbi:family 43 glycosylhydrolase (plasmid) [Catenovulum adriaticum]|uniref:Family 43 glycosylhydrolase n=2 Tax=Catenovulum adriaticum TaxID=2984846 RepID=A0ABY7ASN3_9ALTE|nr:family 43 glycosylhydrolase [Catenovulum sp. TS8]WAJ72489.1 family 43 glycosylhydrolase [Catenovulum sp. TS8]